MKRSVTVESPEGARINIWTAEDGGLTFTGSAPKELHDNNGLCAQQMIDSFIDAVATFFPNCEIVGAEEGQQS